MQPYESRKKQLSENRQTKKRFIKIRDFWCWGTQPNVDREAMQRHLDFLNTAKPYLYDHSLYDQTCNEIRRAINKLNKAEKEQNISDKDIWRNTSEHGLNKVARPITLRYNDGNTLCWNDKYGQQEMKFTTNFMSHHFSVVDTVGYLYLLHHNDGKLPSATKPIFDNIQTLTNYLHDNIFEQDDIDLKITFTDKYFRKFSGYDYTSAKIKALLTETATCQFKLSYPVMMIGEGGKKKENPVAMQNFSPLFTMAIEDQKRSDGNILKRIYTIDFNTTLGILFIHNLMMKNYGFIDNRLYKINPLAQIFYRKFILSNNNPVLTIGMNTVAESLNFTNNNKTIVNDAIKNNVLHPLQDKSIIEKVDFKTGLYDDMKMTIKIPKESKVAKDKPIVTKNKSIVAKR